MIDFERNATTHIFEQSFLIPTLNSNPLCINSGKKSKRIVSQPFLCKFNRNGYSAIFRTNELNISVFVKKKVVGFLLTTRQNSKNVPL